MSTLTTTPPMRRRGFLRGAMGMTLALPFLESLRPRTARAQGSEPMRYVVMVGGLEQRGCVPSGTGPGYTLPAALGSLADVQDLVSLVSGLQIPTPNGGNAPVPPGGRPHGYHGDVMPPLITGWRTPEYAVYEHASSDQIAAPLLSAGTPFESLQFRAQPHSYKGGNGGIGGVISAREGGVQATPQTSPRLAWEGLILGITPDDPTAAAEQMRKLARQKSVLDLVLDHGNHVKNRVASADALRLEKYFDELRDLEARLDSLGGAGASGSCEPLGDPGPEPTQEDHPSVEQGGTTGYSGEDLRSELFVDLIHMALQCDLSRVATFQTTMEQSFMSTAPLWGVNYEVHDLTHVDFAGVNDVWADVTSWQASFFARLVSKLAQSDPAGGPSLLESTVVVYGNTGGQSGHGSTDMVMAMAGPSDVVRRGEHVRVPGAMPCHVYQTAMEALGIVQDYGEVPGTVPLLL